MNSYPLKNWLLFLLPSALGIFLFMIPIPYGKDVKVPIAILADLLNNQIAEYMSIIGLITMIIAALGSLIFAFVKPTRETFWAKLFQVTPFWLVTRILAAIFAIATVFKIGPEAVWSENTGSLLLSTDGLITFLFTVFLFAGFLLPLLLNFGLLEFFGTLMTKVMRPLFKLPGRSSIDALASWVGDGTIGVLMTSKQYEEGYYTKREAAIIGTTFSVVSITFAITILDKAGLSSYFLPYYGTVALVGFVLAVIMPRIFPLAQKDNTYIDGRPFEEKDATPKHPLRTGTKLALDAAKKNSSLGHTMRSGFQNVLDMWIGVIPVVMAFGTVALILAEYTSLFSIIGKPFEPYLNLLNIPQAAEAAPLMVVGFTDMYLPIILAQGVITSQLTMFVVATISIVQLVFLAEVGGLLLGSKIPVNFFDLVIIFILRTVIALPIIAGVGHLLF